MNKRFFQSQLGLPPGLIDVLSRYGCLALVSTHPLNRVRRLKEGEKEGYLLQTSIPAIGEESRLGFSWIPWAPVG